MAEAPGALPFPARGCQVLDWAQVCSSIQLSAGSRDTEQSTDGAAAVTKTTGGDTASLGQMAFLLFLARPLFSHLCKENILTE